MSEPMFRPRSAIEIVDAGFSIYRAHFAALAAIWLILFGPFYIVGVLIGGTLGSTISNLSGLMVPVATGATVAVVSDAMHDRAVTIRGAFGQIAGRAGMLVGVSFVQGLLTFLGMLLLIVPGVIVWCWTFAAPMVVVVEHMGGTAGAFSRSRQLARGQFWHILGTLALSWLIFFAVLIATGAGIGFFGAFIGLSETARDIFISLVVTMVMPIAGAASGVLYFDLRVRNDGYDVERLAQTLDASAPVEGTMSTEHLEPRQ